VIGGAGRTGVAALLLAGLAACSSPVQRSSGIPPTRVDSAGSRTGSPGNPPFYEVDGERFYVMQSSAGYRERGVASWYGPEFNGLRTSGGEVFDMYALTAAHKTLPIPTWVEVTNLSNGKHITVKVNDRGPFVDDRIIDLSYQAALDLDMVRTGTQFVEVRALDGAAAVAADARLASAPRSGPGGFSLISVAAADTLEPEDLSAERLYLQVGAFAERANAQNLYERLRRSGFENAFVISARDTQDKLSRVRIGPLADVAEFDRVSDGLRAMGLHDMRLVAE
jgi:peptidoglycan lytic transglycosylase